MELQPESSKNRTNPSPKDIEEVLNGLGKRDDFVALNNDEGFIQAAGSAAEGVSVEYGDGEGSLYRAMDENVPIAQVIGMFKKFAAGDRTWKSEIEWEDVSSETQGSSEPAERGESVESQKRRAMQAYYHAVTGDVNNRFGRNKGCTGVFIVAAIAALGLAALLHSI